MGQVVDDDRPRVNHRRPSDGADPEAENCFTEGAGCQDNTCGCGRSRRTHQDTGNRRQEDAGNTGGFDQIDNLRR